MANIDVLLLSAGLGSRLGPLTDIWPKCLMPIAGIPLLEYWIQSLKRAKFHNIYINVHYLADEVEAFLDRPSIKPYITLIREERLLGTAGTIKANSHLFKSDSLLVAHADNWTDFDLEGFINFHQYQKPKNCLATMMTFDASNPSACGIVEIDSSGTLQHFYEKVKNPPGNRANAAIYLFSKPILEWMGAVDNMHDISLDVIPHFLGKISTWHHAGIHRDIGILETLLDAQSDISTWKTELIQDKWALMFSKHKIHKLMFSLKNNSSLKVNQSGIL